MRSVLVWTVFMFILVHLGCSLTVQLRATSDAIGAAGRRRKGADAMYL
jgi:hypothetical protein